MVNETFKAKVRGIYTTALTKILLDNGFRIVQPSMLIRERFRLPVTLEDSCQPDIEIDDRFDRQGVNVVGYASAARKLASILLNLLDDVIVRHHMAITTPIELSGEGNGCQFSPETLGEIMQNIVSPIDMRVRFDIEFPALSKKKLDEIRNTIVPTLSGHHYYKACGGKIAYMLEMAEKLLEKGYSAREVEEIFKECILREYPYESSKISIEHVKINGKIFNLGEARIVEFDDSKQQIRLLRVFSSPGIYDGLKVPKEPGDRAITSMKIGDWFFRTSYFSRSGEYKGTYVNLNTPIELYPAKIRYVDLEADICMWPDGRVQKIDFEKLDEFSSRGYISEKLREIVYEKSEEIINALSVKLEMEIKYLIGGTGIN